MEYIAYLYLLIFGGPPVGALNSHYLKEYMELRYKRVSSTLMRLIKKGVEFSC